MRKDLVLAVLWAAVNLTAPLNFDATTADVDDDADDAIECIEPRHDGTQSGERQLEVASHACGERIDGAWLARPVPTPPAAAAVRKTSPHIAVINLTIDAPPAQHVVVARQLLAQALDRCRERGALKVIVTPSGIPRTVVREIAELRGFQFSRLAHDANPATMEFYTDLYWQRAT
jgi:GNAT superfamily N-acetyltransferase